VNDYTAISRISAAGKVTTFRDPGIGAIYGITTGPDGALWFTDQASPAIGRLTTSGTFTLFHDPSLLAPQGIVAGADGNLWFTDAHSGFIVVGCITPSGNFALLGAEAFGNTKGIAAGADGAIWMTINDDDLIGRITTNVTPVIDKITPAPSPAGAQVTIKGENLASAGAVRFNGVAATIVSAAAKKLVVTVPVGATNGFVTVTTPAGTATSPKAFRVS
jgi:streptogramin lyase